MGPVSTLTLMPSASSPREHGLVQTRAWEDLGGGVRRERELGVTCRRKLSGTRECAQCVPSGVCVCTQACLCVHKQ